MCDPSGNYDERYDEIYVDLLALKVTDMEGLQEALGELEKWDGNVRRGDPLEGSFRREKLVWRRLSASHRAQFTSPAAVAPRPVVRAMTGHERWAPVPL